MLIAFTLICLFGLVYSYIGYPLVLWAINCARQKHFGCSRGVDPGSTQNTNNAFPTLSVLVTAHNEEGHIESKIDNTLAAVAYYKSFLQNMGVSREVEVVVASDGSKDRTDDLVRGFESRGVKLVRLEPAAGKEKAQKKALEYVTGDVVVFTDAKVKMAEDALLKFSHHFENQEVGAVSSVDRVEGEATQGSGEGFYVRYEMWLRSLESSFGTLVGLSGSCFAVRRHLTGDLRVDMPSDFALLLSVQKRGLKGLHAEDVVHTYRAVKTEEQEFSRKVRTVLRGITTMFSVKEVLNPFRFGWFAWQIFSHKVCRWLVPVFGLGAWLGSLYMGSLYMGSFYLGSLYMAPSLCGGGQFYFAYGWFFLLVALGGAVILGLALLGYLIPALRSKVWAKIPLFFVVSNAAILTAWIYFLTGKRSVSWQPTSR